MLRVFPVANVHSRLTRQSPHLGLHAGDGQALLVLTKTCPNRSDALFVAFPVGGRLLSETAKEPVELLAAGSGDAHRQAIGHAFFGTLAAQLARAFTDA